MNKYEHLQDQGETGIASNLAMCVIFGANGVGSVDSKVSSLLEFIDKCICKAENDAV